jgi:hypothetical protein
VPFAVPLGQTKSLAGRFFTYAKNFSLNAGKYQITAAVMDRESGKLTAVATDVETGIGAGKVSISSLVMVDHLQKASGNGVGDPLVYRGDRLVPMLSRTIGPAEQRTVYFLAKADTNAAEKPRLEVELLVDGQPAAKQSGVMPEPNESGLIPMSFVAPARTGHCELRLTAVQGENRAMESITYEVAANTK